MHAGLAKGTRTVVVAKWSEAAGSSSAFTHAGLDWTVRSQRSTSEAGVDRLSLFLHLETALAEQEVLPVSFTLSSTKFNIEKTCTLGPANRPACSSDAMRSLQSSV